MKVFRTAYSEPIKCDLDTGPESMTEQCFKDDCDVNLIVKRYTQTGELPYALDRQAFYGDFTEVSSYQEAQNIFNEAEEAFMAIPSDIRLKFENNVSKFIEFYDDPANTEQCYELGLKVKPKEAEPVSS